MSEYTALVSDSRAVTPGSLFFCKGARFKKEYLLSAMEKGAAAYVSETDYGVDIPCILVPDIRKAMADYSKTFFGDPSAHLTLAGITGTKGKSTTLYFLRSIMENAGVCGSGKFGFISTIENYDGQKLEESHLTTPEAIELNTILSNMVKNGLKTAGMEVSSQALKYDRTRGLRYKIGAFTNFSPDHISPEEHSDLEDYFCSKLRLIDQCEAFAVNLDCDRAAEIAAACRKALESGSLQKIITYSKIDPSADYRIENLRKEEGRTVFELTGLGRIELSMPGLFNAENAALAAILAKELGANGEEIRKGLLDARASGRMEIFRSPARQITGIVDFAHNGLSFEKIFSSAREEYPDCRIEAVFGCPGNKSFERRTELPAVAAKYADYCYITEDDPYLEDPLDICREVFANLQRFGGAGEIIPDRKDAITAAVKNAAPKTVLLVLAKGCDTYMHRKNFDPYESDTAIVKGLLENDER